MKRRAFSIAVAALVWVAGIGAPFSHFHHGDSDHAHASSFSHAHLGHPVEHDDDHHEGPAFDHQDDDATAVWEDWSGVVSAKISVHLAILTDRIVVEPAISERRLATPFVLRTHDPPDLSNTSARAPPTV